MSHSPAPGGLRQRVVIGAASKPRLARSFKLQHDKARDSWVIQGPERVYNPDTIALEVLKLCDGNRTVADLADSLALRYDAPKEQILADVASMLQDLADKGMLQDLAEKGGAGDAAGSQ